MSASAGIGSPVDPLERPGGQPHRAAVQQYVMALCPAARSAYCYLPGAAVADVLKAIDFAAGIQTATNVGGTATPATAAGQTVSSISAAGG